MPTAWISPAGVQHFTQSTLAPKKALCGARLNGDDWHRGKCDLLCQRCHSVFCRQMRLHEHRKKTEGLPQNQMLVFSRVDLEVAVECLTGRGLKVKKRKAGRRGVLLTWRR
jgi:hypothetical protein